MVISDNGASAEGGPTGTTNEAQFFNNAQEPLEESLAVIDEIGGPKHFNHYPWGWTWAGNTPFRRWKRETYRGGACDPFIVSWPAGIKAKGEVRTQYAHIIDMVPTVLDLLGIEPPATIRGVTQSPLQGVSFAHTLDDAAAAEPATTRSTSRCSATAPIYHDGWRAVCPWPGPSFTEAGVGFGQPISAEKLSELDANGWELYHVAEDFAENHNVAARAPRQADRADRDLVRRGRQVRRHAGRRQRPRPHGRREAAGRRCLARRYTYRPGTQSIPFFAAPRLLNRPHSITASVEIPEGGAEGVLLCQGTAAGGYSLYIKDGKLHYVHNYVGRALYEVDVRRGRAGRQARAALRVRADRRARPAARQGRAGRLQLYVDGALVGERRGAVDDAVHAQPRRSGLRRQPRLAGHAGLPQPVQVHRHPPRGHGGRQRRADPRPRGRAARAHGAAVRPLRYTPFGEQDRRMTRAGD